MMHGNNEIGTVNDIKALSEVAHEAGALMHTDAAQTLGKVPFNVTDLGVDAASFSSHKIYGPKGVARCISSEAHPSRPKLVAAARSPRGGRAPRTRPASSAWPRHWRSCLPSSRMRWCGWRRCATA